MLRSLVGSEMCIRDRGYYRGDWRNSEVEAVRWVIFLSMNSLYGLADRIQRQLILFFSQKSIHRKQIEQFFYENFSLYLSQTEPFEELGVEDVQLLDSCMRDILSLEQGVHTTFSEILEKAYYLIKGRHISWKENWERLLDSSLISKRGEMRENRSLLFERLHEIISDLSQNIQIIRDYFDRLDTAIAIKRKVLRIPLEYASPFDGWEETQKKMGSYRYLVVAHPSRENNQLIVLGIVRAEHLRKQILGTVSLRDFCNRREVHIPSYLEIISVIDHHKVELTSSFPPTLLVGDVQSSNVLLAEEYLRFSREYGADFSSKRESLVEKKKEDEYFIAESREGWEILSLLYAILDDTDLLQKVSERDIVCITALLHRLKSLQLRQNVSWLHFDDLPRDRTFAQKAAQRILSDSEVYSLYKEIYSHRIREITQQIETAAKEGSMLLFSDTKEQNGCVRVGQTKLFASHFPLLEQEGKTLHLLWLTAARETSQNFPPLSFHLHMISTLPDAEEVYAGRECEYKHHDQIWIWVEEGEKGRELLIKFLSSFSHAPYLQNIELSITLFGPLAVNYGLIFSQYLPSLSVKKREEGAISWILLHFSAGTLNSRKGAITPYLPSS